MICVKPLDQLAKPTFYSRYAHTPFGSAPLPILSSWKVITNVVMKSEELGGVSFVIESRPDFNRYKFCVDSGPLAF